MSYVQCDVDYTKLEPESEKNYYFFVKQKSNFFAFFIKTGAIHFTFSDLVLFFLHSTVLTC